MKVLHVASELFPLIKTGGLADVLGALPFAQQQLGQDIRVLLPAYPTILKALPDAGLVGHYDSFAGSYTLLHGNYQGIGIYLLDSPLFSREGNPYHDDNYQDYADNFLRFALLGFVGAELARGIDSFWQPEVVHAHDWHAGLTCAYIKQNSIPVKSLFTIHNIAYQGLFSAHHIHDIALDPALFNINGLEFYGQLSYLKAGLYFADEVTTVSPTFAKEITGESHGFGLQGLLQMLDEQGRLHGILNGIDENVWNPASDPYLAKPYKIGAMTGKANNKAALQRHFKLPNIKDTPIFVMVSRLTEQKGVDLFIDSIDTIVKNRGQVIVLGSGAPEFESALLTLNKKYPKNVGIIIGYDENLAHLIVAGGDVIVIPSRFEPCGLTQLYGLKYGTLPLVRNTGGLADTVVHMDENSFKSRQATGFVFEDMSAKALSTTVNQVFELWKTSRKWSSVRANAMRQNFTWQQSAEAYINLYN